MYAIRSYYADDKKMDPAELVKALNIIPDPEESSVEVDEVRLISENDFTTRKKEYEKVCVTYYDHDHIFAMDDETEISDPVDLFGPNIHLHFGTQSPDPDAVYVRNDRLEIV